MADQPAVSEHVQTKLRRLVDRKREKAMADQKAKDATKALTEEQEACYDELEELLGPVSSISVDLGPGYGKQQFTRQSQVYHTIIAKEMAYRGLEDAALIDEATRPDFNGTFLNQLVQERIRNGQDLPEGIGFRRKRWITVTSR